MVIACVGSQFAGLFLKMAAAALIKMATNQMSIGFAGEDRRKKNKAGGHYTANLTDGR